MCCSSATKRTERHKERERKKETKLLQLKARLCSILLFLDVQSPKSTTLGLTMIASLSLSQKMCVGCVGVHRRKKREKEKEGVFFKDVQNPKRKFTPKKIHPFFSSFFFTVFILSGRLSSWISLSLSLSSTQTTQTTTSAVFGGGGGFTRVVFVFYCCCC